MHSRAVVAAKFATAERRAELRAADRHRCTHRSTEAIREEPCGCPAIVLLPVYRCELLGVECADLRRPQAPATFCGDCSHRAGPSMT